MIHAIDDDNDIDDSNDIEDIWTSINTPYTDKVENGAKFDLNLISIFDNKMQIQGFRI